MNKLLFYGFYISLVEDDEKRMRIFVDTDSIMNI